jgi:hypothetical protein
MSSIFLNYEKFCSLTDLQESEESKRFLRFLLMQSIQVEGEAKDSSSPLGQVDLAFVFSLGLKLLGKKEITVGMLEGRWQEFLMLPED